MFLTLLLEAVLYLFVFLTFVLDVDEAVLEYQSFAFLNSEMSKAFFFFLKPEMSKPSPVIVTSSTGMHGAEQLLEYI
jgi:hypothetical protein